MPRAGMLIQLDTSEHLWFGPHQAKAALVGAIGDATGEVLAGNDQEHENTLGTFRLLHSLATAHGLPEACTADRHAIFLNSGREGLTIDEQIAGAKDHPSQFAQLLARLGVALVFARSPQAKGRIERLLRTLQDRLVVELRLAGISSIADANAFLPAFLQDFNARFPVAATVKSDHTVQRLGLCLQLTPTPGEHTYCRCRVEIWRFLDDHLEVRHEGQPISAHIIPTPPAKVPQIARQTPCSPPRYKGHTPAPDHPLRRYPYPPKSLATDIFA